MPPTPVYRSLPWSTVSCRTGLLTHDWLAREKAMMALVGVVDFLCVRALKSLSSRRMMGLARQGWVIGETSQVGRWLTLLVRRMLVTRSTKAERLP